jgi:hypothetical protein
MSDHTDVDKFLEHAKMKAVIAQSRTIGAFIDWLQQEREPRMELCERRTFTVRGAGGEDYETSPEWVPSCGSVERLLAEYFGIDLKKIEDEKRQMLDELREAHEQNERPSGATTE